MATHTTFQELLLTPFNVPEILGFEILSSEKHFCLREISEILSYVRGLDPCLLVVICCHTARASGLPISDCARGCDNRARTHPQLSAIDVTEKTFFERLYLVPGMDTFGS